VSEQKVASNTSLFVPDDLPHDLPFDAVGDAVQGVASQKTG
jgi:hypothetical protein